MEKLDFVNRFGANNKFAFLNDRKIPTFTGVTAKNCCGPRIKQKKIFTHRRVKAKVIIISLSKKLQ